MWNSRIFQVVCLMLWSSLLFAAEAQDIAGIVGNIRKNIDTIAPLMIVVSYISGVAFLIAGIVQFKAHKDNPTQVPLSKPLVYLAVGAGLLFLPVLMQSAGQTVFGGTEGAAKSGQDLFQ